MLGKQMRERRRPQLLIVSRRVSITRRAVAHLAFGYVNGLVQHYPHGRLPAAGMGGRPLVRHVVLDVREHLSDGYVLYRAQRTCGKKTSKTKREHIQNDIVPTCGTG